MSIEELHDWMIFSAVEPFGVQRADYQAAIIAATVANSQGARRKIVDFMPFLRAQHEKAESSGDLEARLHREFAKATKRLKVHFITGAKEKR